MKTYGDSCARKMCAYAFMISFITLVIASIAYNQYTNVKEGFNTGKNILYNDSELDNFERLLNENQHLAPTDLFQLLKLQSVAHLNRVQQKLKQRQNDRELGKYVNEKDKAEAAAKKAEQAQLERSFEYGSIFIKKYTIAELNMYENLFYENLYLSNDDYALGKKLNIKSKGQLNLIRAQIKDMRDKAIAEAAERLANDPVEIARKKQIEDDKIAAEAARQKAQAELRAISTITNQYGVTVYQGCDGTGSKSFLPAGSYDEAALKSSGLYKTIQSMYLGPNCVVSTKNPYHMDFLRDQPCLANFKDNVNSSTNWSSNITSLDIYCSKALGKAPPLFIDDTSKGAFVYPDCKQGTSPIYLAPGSYDEQAIHLNSAETIQRVNARTGCMLQVQPDDDDNRDIIFRGDICHSKVLKPLQIDVVCD